MAARGVARWIASLRDFPARPSASPANGRASATSDGSGPSSSASFAWYDPDTCSWKMSEGSLEIGGHSATFSADWPASGTIRSGRAYERAMSVPRIGGSGCSFWPTPTRRDAKGAFKSHTKSGRDLSNDVCLFPTPSAQTYGSNQGGAAGRTGPIRPSLETWARSPQAQAITTDGDDGLKPAAPRRLNPAFVEMLRGFRVGYTDLQHWATPSSRSRRHMRGDCSAVGDAVEVTDGTDPGA